MGKHRAALLGRKRNSKNGKESELDKVNRLKKEREQEEVEIEEEEFEFEAGEEDDEVDSGEDEEDFEDEEGEDSESSEEDKDKPKKSLFGDIFANKPASGGLFGSLGDKNSDGKLFSGVGSLFANSSLFNPGASLFSSNANTATKSNSLFGDKPLFSFSAIGTENKKSEKEAKSDDEEAGSEDDNPQRSESPNPYNPLQQEQQENKSKDKSPYSKKFVKEVDSFFVYAKDEGKYISRGKGFLSLEYAETDGKKIGVIVLRNSLGNKIVEGFMTPKLKLTRYAKNPKNIATFSYFCKGENRKFEIRHSKVPVRIIKIKLFIFKFSKEDHLNEFEKSFNDLLEVIADENKDDRKTNK